MARPLKEGLDYYPRKVGIYDDPKVIDLILDCGYIGFVIWDYLLDKIYQNGYYYPWNAKSQKAIAFKMSGGITDGQVREAVEACCKCGLFDEAVLTACGVLTSRGVQRRYKSVAAERRNKEVIAEYWLFDESESDGLVLCPLKKVSTPNNPSYQPENPSNSADKYIEESKVKESRGKGSRAGDKKLTPGAFDQFWVAYPRKVAKGEAHKVWEKIKPDNVLAEKILSAVELAKRSDQWTRDGGRFIPHPTTWLNQGRWDDELAAKLPAKNSSASYDINELERIIANG